MMPCVLKLSLPVNQISPVTTSDTYSSEGLERRLEVDDGRALADLFWSHRERLKRLVEFRLDRRLRGRVDPSDVLQEVYIDASQRIRRFGVKPGMAVFVWLRYLTMQRLIDTHRLHLNAKKRDVRQEFSIHCGGLVDATSASLAEHLVGHLTSPSRLAARAELLERVEHALQGLNAIDREVLALRHFEELTNNEVAEVLGITKAAASNRYMRALARLRELLATLPGFFDDPDAD
jgi:RNA polymerase sigma-70 factor (ECF subfamily)